MKVLHITNWYPKNREDLEGIFIQEHIRSLDNHTKNIKYLVKNSFSWEIGIKSTILIDDTIFLEVRFPTHIWKIKEILIAIAVIKILITNYRKIDVINFHIAYPLLTYWHLFQPFIKKPVVCNEHWSAYALNFNIDLKERNKLKNIKKIFVNKIFFMPVSNFLANSIEVFSNRKLKYSVLGNVVNNKFSYNDKATRNSQSFFMAAVWRYGKNPLTIIKAFKNLTRKYPEIQLRIAGSGQQIEEMKRLISSLELAKNITLLGVLNKHDIAIEMQMSAAFIHNSIFETFSVVCAESLCCGTPVIVSKLPAIEEYMREGVDGIFVVNNSIYDWEYSIEHFLESINNFNHREIANRSMSLFSREVIGEKYFDILKKQSEKNN